MGRADYPQALLGSLDDDFRAAYDPSRAWGYSALTLPVATLMENFVVSARKYRPSTFRSVVGQQHVTTTLQNAIQSQHLAQAFLFCGPRGVGKTTCARILAKTINCTNLAADTEACGQCASCQAFQNNASFNVHELDAASNNSVEDIRGLVEQVRYPPQAGSRYKIYIIDEVHMLSNAAFNAFLKTLEEPPSYAIFILATTERHKIIPTILSRCQVFDFGRIKVDDMSRHLRYVATQEGITADDDALHLLAQKADGGLRDALSMFDQMVTFSGSHLGYREVVQNLHILDYDYYFRLVDALLDQDLSAALLLLDEVMQQGFDLHNFVVGTAEHLRGLLVCKDPVTVQLLEVSEGIRLKYINQAQVAPLAFLLSALNLMSQCDRDFKQAKNQRLHVELVLMKLAYLNGAVEFVRQHSANGHAASPANGEAKKKTSAGEVMPAATAPTAPAPPSFANSLVTELAPAYVSGRDLPESTTNAPADGPDPLPVENGVTELHPTPSIEPDAAAAITARHQMRDTLPHVEIGVPSMEGLEPQPRPNAAGVFGRRPGAASIMPSLKDVGQAAAPTTTQTVENPASADASATPIAAEVLNQVWRELVAERLEQERMSEYTLLNRPVEADAQHQIELRLDNGVQVGQFNEMRTEFLGELRRRTGHRSLNVNPVVAASTSGVRKLYTSTDKFNYLADKFPALKEAKERLGLETAF